MPHKHGVYDTDPYFVLKKQTRTLTNKSTTPTKVMQFDHNCERITLELPRVIDGHDMTLCNSVQVHYINIDASNKDVQKFGVYEVTDLQAAKDDESIAICSWLISQNATQYIGPLYFVFSFRCLDENGEITYRLNTARYEELAVSTGIDNGQYITEEYADILAQWETRIEALDFENINTLSELYCEETESEFVSGATDAHYLKFGGRALRYVADGAVISSVMSVEKDGQSYLRLRLNDNRSVIINDNIPDFVDIPVSAIVEKEEATGGIILNGSVVELPSGGGGASSVTVDADGYIVIG